jgi:DNA polymerase III epsilon subunit-like protein
MARSFTQAPGLITTSLTRRPAGPDARGLVFTAVDVETTGLDEGDRIVELAAVVFRGDGEVLDEYATLVDPLMPVSSGARDIHGLADADLAGAPRAGVVLPELWALSAGTVLVAHNLEFIARFLVTESQWAGLPLPSMVAVCTQRTARTQLDGRTFNLGPLYRTATGEWLDDQHSALADARAVSTVLSWMLREVPGGLHLQHWPIPQPDPRYARVLPSRLAPRPAPASSNELSEFVRRFPRSRVRRPTAPGAEARYLQLLDEVVADERVSVDEAADLEACARAGGLTQVPLEELHREAFFRVMGEEVRVPPAALSPVRRREFLALAKALGVPEVVAVLGPLVEADRAAERKPAGTGYLKGWRIGLDPADSPDLAALRQLADQHDASVAKKLTKTVRFLATTSGTPAQAKARELGIPIVPPHEAHRIMDDAIRAADLAAFERRQVQARWEAERAEADRQWRHTWKRAEDPAAADNQRW